MSSQYSAEDSLNDLLDGTCWCRRWWIVVSTPCSSLGDRLLVQCCRLWLNATQTRARSLELLAVALLTGVRWHLCRMTRVRTLSCRILVELHGMSSTWVLVSNGRRSYAWCDSGPHERTAGSTERMSMFVVLDELFHVS